MIRVWRSITCWLHRHRPDHEVGGDIWRCKCGKQAWRDEHKYWLIPGPMFGWAGFSKIEDERGVLK